MRLINLIKNELVKIFSKKSFYIILIVCFAIIFYNFASKGTEEKESRLDSELNSILIQKSGVDTSSYSGLMEYVELQTKYEVYKDIGEKYGDDSWQFYVLVNNYSYNAFEMFHDYYFKRIQEEEFSYTGYEIENPISEEESSKKYEKINEIFESGDWKKFASFQSEIFENKLEQLKKTDEAKLSEDTKKDIKSLEIDLEKINIRLNKDIAFGYTYRNDAVEDYGRCKYSIYLYDLKSNKSYLDERYYQEDLEDFENDKYIIENNQDIVGDESTARFNLANVFDIYGEQLFIILLIIYVSATIVSEESNKGTIKQLLIRPNSRMKVLLAKFITCIIMILFSATIITLMVLISSLILKRDGTLKIPMTIYNFNTGKLMVMGMFKFLVIQFLSKLPMFLGVLIISFAISTIFDNSIIAVLVPIFIYMSNLFFDNGANIYDKVPKNVLFLNTNWDLSNVIFGRLAEYGIFTFNFQLLVCVIYFIIMLIPTFMIFKNKDIKNK